MADAELFDVLVVPGGYGQQALMRDEEVLELIRRHVQRKSFSFHSAPALCCVVRLVCSQEDR